MSASAFGIAARRALAVDSLGATAGGALVGDVRVRAISRAIDVDLERVHGEPVEDDRHQLMGRMRCRC
jgi:hypothetical protein